MDMRRWCYRAAATATGAAGRSGGGRGTRGGRGGREGMREMAKVTWVVPQIAIAIGVLTFPITGEGDEPLWRIGRGTRVPLQGAVDVVPLLGAIVVCHWVCYGWGGGWRPTLGEWTWCHCRVPLQGGRTLGERGALSFLKKRASCRLRRPLHW